MQETADSSAWNHIFKFRRLGLDGRRSRKPMSLRHTHGSAPRSPYLSCEILDQWKKSELEQNDGISYRKNREVEVVPVIALSADSGSFFFCGRCNIGSWYAALHRRVVKAPWVQKTKVRHTNLPTHDALRTAKYCSTAADALIQTELLCRTLGFPFFYDSPPFRGTSDLSPGGPFNTPRSPSRS